jgi:hypothetical protein
MLTRDSRRRILFRMTSAFLLLFILALLGSYAKIIRPKDSGNSRYEVPIEQMFSGRMVGLLGKIGTANVVPDLKVIEEIKSESQNVTPRSILNYSTTNDRSRYSSDQDPLLSSAVIKKNIPIVSLIVSPHDLSSGQKSLFKNPFEHGRDWEKPAYFSFYEHGNVVLRSGVGLRLSGGETRQYNRFLSFRLYFRDIYGHAFADSKLIFGQDLGQLKSLILNSDLRKGVRDIGDVWQFVNPLSYDLARQAGGLASQTKPVQLFLNGKERGVFVITERQDRTFLSNHFGHSDFVKIDLREQLAGPAVAEIGDAKLRDDFRDWVHSYQPKMTLRAAQSKVDLRSLMIWFLLSTYGANTDPFQGYAYLNMQTAQPRWFWSVWDLDHSFRDVYGARRDPWNANTFWLMLKNKAKVALLPELKLIRRLQREDSEFPEYVARLYSEIFNHRVTPSFIASRVDYYESLSKSYKIVHQRQYNRMRKFFEMRSEAFCRQLGAYFKVGESVKLSILAEPSVKYSIDGYQKSGNHVGRYFKNTPPVISFESSNRRIIKNDGSELVLETGSNVLQLNSDLVLKIE